MAVQTVCGRHWEGYHKVMATGVTRCGRELLVVPALRKDGTRISLEFTVVLLRNEAGQPMGAAALIRDVTAHWQQGKALEERLADLEAKSARWSFSLSVSLCTFQAEE